VEPGRTGDAAEKYRGARGLDPELIHQLERQYGFDKPAHERFLTMLQQHPNVLILAVLLTFGGLGLVLIGLWFLVRWLLRWRLTREFLQLSRQRTPVSWSLGDVVRIIVLTLWWITVFPFIELGYVSLIRAFGEFSAVRQLVSSTYLCVLVVCAVVLLARAKGLPLETATGLRRRSLQPIVPRALGGYLTLVPALAGLLLLSSWVARAMGYEPPPHPLSLFFLDETRAAWLSYGVVFTCLIAPAVEELMFRGIIFPALRARTSFVLAAATSSLLFGALHGNWVSFLPIASLGILLAYLYEITGSLYASILVHGIHNSLMVLLMFFYRALSQAVGA